MNARSAGMPSTTSPRPVQAAPVRPVPVALIAAVVTFACLTTAFVGWLVVTGGAGNGIAAVAAAVAATGTAFARLHVVAATVAKARRGVCYE
jgi:hypothetical protein